jgi:hypothetical protein
MRPGTATRGIIHRLSFSSFRRMLRRHLQKIGSILGLLAILMATLAPTVSQALSSHERLDTALAERCTAAQDVTDVERSAPHPLVFHWQACGYCGLLAHFPVVPPAGIVFVTQAVFAHAVTVHASANTRSISLVTSAQPRAPPAVL